MFRRYEKAGLRRKIMTAMKTVMCVIAVAVVCVVSGTPAMAQIVLDLEGGRVFPGYNDVRIPGNSGTEISLYDEIETDAAWYGRLRAGYLIGERHFVSVLAAPLRVRGTGSVNRDVSFDGTVFPANTPLESTFQFNTYRAGYRYDFYKSARGVIGAGITLLVRDAYIEIEGGGQSAKNSNLGFVPLIHFRILGMFVPAMGVLIEGDALASSQGRAFDIFTGLVFPVTPDITVKAGYRFLEGGADNDKVYTFSLFHFAALGVEVRL